MKRAAARSPKKKCSSRKQETRQRVKRRFAVSWGERNQQLRASPIRLPRLLGKRTSHLMMNDVQAGGSGAQNGDEKATACVEVVATRNLSTERSFSIDRETTVERCQAPACGGEGTSEQGILNHDSAASQGADPRLGLVGPNATDSSLQQSVERIERNSGLSTIDEHNSPNKDGCVHPESMVNHSHRIRLGRIPGSPIHSPARPIGVVDEEKIKGDSHDGRFYENLEFIEPVKLRKSDHDGFLLVDTATGTMNSTEATTGIEIPELPSSNSIGSSDLFQVVEPRDINSTALLKVDSTCTEGYAMTVCANVDNGFSKGHSTNSDRLDEVGSASVGAIEFLASKTLPHSDIATGVFGELVSEHARFDIANPNDTALHSTADSTAYADEPSLNSSSTLSQKFFANNDPEFAKVCEDTNQDECRENSPNVISDDKDSYLFIHSKETSEVADIGLKLRCEDNSIERGVKQQETSHINSEVCPSEISFRSYQAEPRSWAFSDDERESVDAMTSCTVDATAKTSSSLMSPRTSGLHQCGWTQLRGYWGFVWCTFIFAVVCYSCVSSGRVRRSQVEDGNWNANASVCLDAWRTQPLDDTRKRWPIFSRGDGSIKADGVSSHVSPWTESEFLIACELVISMHEDQEHGHYDFDASDLEHGTSLTRDKFGEEFWSAIREGMISVHAAPYESRFGRYLFGLGFTLLAVALLRYEG